MNRGWFGVVVAVGALVLGTAGSAQFVSGDWVQRAEASIQKHRKTPVSFLVLDAEGKLAAEAEVRLEQTAHAFTVGFVAHEGFPVAFDPAVEGWRAFNTVSLAGVSSWRRVQPGGSEDFDTQAIDAVIADARDHGLEVHWGPLVSADAFDLPEWVVPLRGSGLAEAARGYLRRVTEAYAKDLEHIDLAEQTLDHDRLSPALLRLLALDLRASGSGAAPSLRYESALAGRRTFDVVDAVDGMLKERIAVDAFSVEHTFVSQPIAQDLLEPAVKRLSKFGRPWTVGSLEVGGSHAIEVAVNTETVLRTLFAEPTVTGVTFAGLYAEELDDPSAALFEADGTVSSAGRTLDRLFRESWWSDDTLTTDDLGQAQTRVFRGTYRVTATLPDGSAVTVRLDLSDRNEKRDEVVLMPVAEEP